MKYPKKSMKTANTTKPSTMPEAIFSSEPPGAGAFTAGSALPIQANSSTNAVKIANWTAMSMKTA